MTDAQLIAEIEAQEARLRFPGFSNDDALRLGLLIVRLATERSLGVTVDITRGEQQLVHIALDGSTADNDAWIARKTRVVRRFAASSLLVGLRQGSDFNTKFDLFFFLRVEKHFKFAKAFVDDRFSNDFFDHRLYFFMGGTVFHVLHDQE